MRFLQTILSVCAIAGLAHATPVQWAGNGHWYEYVPAGGISWTSAAQMPVAADAQGTQPYLATVTSQGENDFILGLLGYVTAWLGATDAEEEGKWEWRSGPEAGTQLSYANWNDGEPNNLGEKEHYLMIYGANGLWNDCPDDCGINGYVVEWSDTSAVPEPGTFGLLGTALLAGWLLRRR